MSNFIREEIVHVNGQPKSLIVFLHGYIDNAETVEKAIEPLINSLDNVAIHIPDSPCMCEIYDGRRQWYSMHRFDPNDDRKTVSTIEECVGIYDKMSLGFAEINEHLREYLDNLLNEYQLEDKNLFICGFSQGAMLGIYSSLLRENKIAGCVSFCGVLAPHSYVKKHVQSTPDILLIHGDKDNLVRFEALEFTTKNLQEIGCNVKTKVIPEGQHRITDDGVAEMITFIKAKTKSKVIPFKKAVA